MLLSCYTIEPWSFDWNQRINLCKAIYCPLYRFDFLKLGTFKVKNEQWIFFFTAFSRIGALNEVPEMNQSAWQNFIPQGKWFANESHPPAKNWITSSAVHVSPSSCFAVSPTVVCDHVVYVGWHSFWRPHGNPTCNSFATYHSAGFWLLAWAFWGDDQVSWKSWVKSYIMIQAWRLVSSVLLTLLAKILRGVFWPPRASLLMLTHCWAEPPQSFKTLQRDPG